MVIAIFLMNSSLLTCSLLLQIKIVIIATKYEKECIYKKRFSLTRSIFQAIKIGFVFGIVQTSFICFYLLVAMYIPCHFGNEVTFEFDGIWESVYDVSWYEFPVETAKHFPFILEIAEKAVNMKVFGNIVCTRDLFKKVCIIIFKLFYMKYYHLHLAVLKMNNNLTNCNFLFLRSSTLLFHSFQC